MARAVLDASAVIALLRDEPGAEVVADHAGDAMISAVNLQEVVRALLSRGAPIDIARQMLEALRLEVRPHDAEDAYLASALHEATARYGAGLGDRTCMALAIRQGLPAITTDRDWMRLAIPGLTVILVR
jgi:PIN domain nuclease of toxin-antitoxin system